MDLSDKDVAALKKLRSYEENNDPTKWTMPPNEFSEGGYSWEDVGVFTGTLNKLIALGLVKLTYRSNRFKHYKLTELGKTIELTIDSLPFGSSVGDIAALDLSHLFDDIIGYDDLKELYINTLQLEKPLHVLTYGPPSIAKTMFLMDIERACGGSSMWILGSGASKAGLWDELVTKRPKYLLIDELEKMATTDHAGLLSLLEKGRITRVKAGRKFDEIMQMWVFATANRIHRLSPELLSRFAKYCIYEYSPSEYINVVKNVLMNRENLNPLDANAVATLLVGKTHDVRDAIRVANLSKRVGVTRAVELLIR